MMGDFEPSILRVKVKVLADDPELLLCRTSTELGTQIQRLQHSSGVSIITPAAALSNARLGHSAQL